jgi:PPE-repeat protein
VIDFSALPPEINSGRLYAGAGPGPLSETARAWSMLSRELYSAATECGSVVTQLAAIWEGPSATGMQAAARRYLAWLTATAEHAAQSAAAARAAVEAFTVVRAAVVPPAVIAANRGHLLALIATNVLGHNTAAIAATEAQYEAMWAQDAAAMNAYAASSSAVTAQLPTFEPSPQVSNSSANPVVAAAQQPAAGIATIIQQLNALLTELGLGTDSPTGQYIQAFASSGLPVDIIALFTSFFGPFLGSSITASAIEDVATRELAAIAAPPSPVVTAPASAAPAEVKAAAGAAAPLSRMSVPPSWATPHVGNRGENSPPIATPLSVQGQTAIPAVPFMPVTGMRSNQGKVRDEPEYGHVSKVVPPRHPAGG